MQLKGFLNGHVLWEFWILF